MEDFYDSYYPVRTILELPDSALKSAMKDNGEVWSVDDNIPKHMLRYRIEHPGAAVDPEAPPIRELVNAIKFLQWKHLQEVYWENGNFPSHISRYLDPHVISSCLWRSKCISVHR